MRTLHAILPAAVFGCLLTAPSRSRAGNGENTKLNLGSADEPAAQASSGPGGGSIVRTIVGLAVVLGVIYGLHWVLKQIKASKDSTASGDEPGDDRDAAARHQPRAAPGARRPRDRPDRHR